jgi:hypothetical protein
MEEGPCASASGCKADWLLTQKRKFVSYEIIVPSLASHTQTMSNGLFGSNGVFICPCVGEQMLSKRKLFEMAEIGIREYIWHVDRGRSASNAVVSYEIKTKYCGQCENLV